ncbi:secondary thiamine-phosphate synthase enzyme YjbQ [Desulfobacter postgatei]|jgi:secondary thiamine-phosphate synthase enzyme|uniref:Secondary thiamine-phosphate synthase enzyme n=1 Tax=Desulfobacter postgatei 2ac9 TaxID=879212 RepID=I5B145_9BACT|nr:secondary thiamine-phosphate synthase enzyme YjbQ [Desulfobacter postgatei]EIM63208.1 secondary thiamine-phosphate synthase enzyme [Desulfobacter postgatei 2ac9]
MKDLQLYTNNLSVDLATGPDIQDITPDLQTWVKDTGIKTGNLEVFIKGSTGSVSTIEYEPGVVTDLKRAINSLAPPGLEYAHEQAWHDGNGHSHVQAALLGPSVSIPVRDGNLTLGTWQQVVVINHDNGPRKRTVLLTLVGSS